MFFIHEPVSLNLGPFHIQAFGALMVVAAGLGYLTAVNRAKRTGFNRQQLRDASLWIMYGAIIGARLLYLVDPWAAPPLIHPWYRLLKFWEGHCFYGGLFGGISGLVLYSYFHRAPLLQLADLTAPSVALGSAIGRVGCFFAGCCWGTPTTAFWSVRYSQNHATGGGPLHPTQLYHAFISALIFVVLEIAGRKKLPEGQIFALLLLLYSGTRMPLEYLRGEYTDNQLLFGFTPGQYTSIPIFLIGCFLYWHSVRPLKRNPVPA